MKFKDAKRLLCLAFLLGAVSLGIGLAAQDQSGSAQDRPPESQRQSPLDSSSQHSARAFDGRIIRAGNAVVFLERSTRTSYRLDDQQKAKQFVGRDVEVTATIDPATNTLHVIDIIAPNQ